MDNLGLIFGDCDVVGSEALWLPPSYLPVHLATLRGVMLKFWRNYILRNVITYHSISVSDVICFVLLH